MHYTAAAYRKDDGPQTAAAGRASRIGINATSSASLLKCCAEKKAHLKAPGFSFDNTYASLPARFFSRVEPTAVSAPRLLHLNDALARQLNLDPDWLAGDEGLQILCGNTIAAGSEPLAQAYAGHQFGHFVPQLGDGRANLLGEVVGRNGVRYDVQLKGSGPTAFSRRGDGRAALGPVLREYIVSEAMTALGIPSTRALAAVTTGEHVQRERSVPGAILTRVAASHLRVGTFQYFAARQDVDALHILADYAITRHYPDAMLQTHKYRAFLDGVIARQASLIAQWMLVGFIHGVMNTDNMSISGETIDYGPCAFLEAYEPDKTFSSIDRQGRYAYGNQPHAAHWNLGRLAEALLPLLAEEAGDAEAGLASAHEALGAFERKFTAAYNTGLRQKLGLVTSEAGDDELMEDLLARMAANRADFTLTFRTLCNAAADNRADASVRSLFADPSAYDAWARKWHERLVLEIATPDQRAAAMRLVNPVYIPRNHKIEQMITAAVDRGDYAPFQELLRAMELCCQEHAEFAPFAVPARPEECVRETFCGT